MSHSALQNLIGRAIVDRGFRDQLLNGNREQAMADFNLTDDEMSAINSIEARNFEAFASELDNWIGVRGNEPKRRRTLLV